MTDDGQKKIQLPAKHNLIGLVFSVNSGSIGLTNWINGEEVCHVKLKLLVKTLLSFYSSRGILFSIHYLL
jgi:hypothetical protein